MNFLEQLTVTEWGGIVTSVFLALGWVVSTKMTAAKSNIDILSTVIDHTNQDRDRYKDEAASWKTSCQEALAEAKEYKLKERTWEGEKDVMFQRIKDLEKELQQLRQTLELSGLLKS